MPLLPLVLIVLPLIEIAGFALVGSLVGVLPTVALAIATTMLGAVLLRVQGFGALTRIRATLEAGGAPGRDLVHGLMIALAGLLLVVPGFFTDALGLLLFLPLVRELAWRFLRSRVTVETAGFRRAGPRTIDLDADDFARRNGPPPRRPLPGGED